MTYYYTEDHEWVSVEGAAENGAVATVGITAYAAKQLGDIVAADLPELDTEFDKGDEAGAVDSTKAAAEVYTPIGGTITAVNEKLEDAPELVNDSPLGDGWLWKLTIADAGELEGLMDEAKYKEFCAEL